MILSEKQNEQVWSKSVSMFLKVLNVLNLFIKNNVFLWEWPEYEAKHNT